GDAIMPDRCVRILGLVLLALVVVAARGQQAEPKDVKKQAAYLKVTVPPDNRWAAETFHTELKIDDTPTKVTGTTRNFYSPPLEVGKKYSYTLTVVFTINNYTKITRKRDVVVQAGQTTEVDLTKKDDNIPDDIEIRFVPTPWGVVEKMLELGGV